MAFNRGKNAGFTGIVNMNVDATTGNYTFTAQISSHTGGFSHEKIDRNGRGSDGFPLFRLGDLRGGGTFKGKVQAGGYPMPANSKYATGSITRQFDTNNKVTYPVLISGVNYSHDEKNDDGWGVTGECILNGEPVWTWKGVQVVLSAPPPSDQELYSGTSKTYDRWQLVSSAVRRVDCFGITDDDASEQAKLASLVTEANNEPPMPGLKVTDAAWMRTDSDGGVALLHFGLRDSKDNVEIPGTKTVIDPNSLSNYSTVTNLNATTSTLTGLSLRTFDIQQLNGTNFSYTGTFGLRSTKADIENPGTFTFIDPATLGSHAQTTLLNNTSNTLSGFVFRGQNVNVINPFNTEYRSEFGLRSTVEDITLPGTSAEFNTLEPDEKRTTTVENSTQSDYAYGAAVLLANSTNNAFLESVHVTTHVPGKKIVTLIEVNPGVLVREEVYGREENFISRVSGGNIQVYVADIKQAAGFYWIRLAHSRDTRVYADMTVIRKYSNSTVPDNRGDIGAVNTSSSIFGTAGLTKYLGATGVQTRFDITGARPNKLGYKFRYRQDGWHRIDGWREWITTTASLSTGWTNISSITDGGLTGSFPAQVNFDPVATP